MAIWVVRGREFFPFRAVLFYFKYRVNFSNTKLLSITDNCEWAQYMLSLGQNCGFDITEIEAEVNFCCASIGSYTYRSKKSGTWHFCDKKQTNQHIAMKFKIHTIQPIIQVMWKSYYPTSNMCNFFTKLGVSCFHYFFSNRSHFYTFLRYDCKIFTWPV